MTKTALALVLLTLLAVPAFAQSNNQLGIMFGGVSRRPLGADKDSGLTSNDWKLGDSVKEIFYSIAMEPGVRFKIKAGQMDSAITFVSGAPGSLVRTHLDGQVEHIEGLMNYSFSEPYGSTGLFAGAGLYRQSGGGQDETNYGLSAGVNGDFPLSPRYGIVVEGTYHWINFAAKSRYVTGTVGLRISF